MALNKQNLAIPFSTGIDTFTDPLQVMPTNLIDLQNAIFTQDKKIIKRNGFGTLTSLPANVFPTTLTTFNGNLTVIGNSVQAFNESNNTWINHGRYQPVQLSVLPLARGSTNQTACDSSSFNNLTCSVYHDSLASGYLYQINDNITGQTLVTPVALPATANLPRVFTLGNYFIITFLATVSATPHLQYIAIPVASITSPLPATDISSLVKSITTGYDAVVLNNYLYIAWNGSDGGGAIRVNALSSGLALLSPSITTGFNADLMSVCTDSTNIWVSWYDSGTTTVYTMAIVPLTLGTALAPTASDTTDTINLMTSSAINGVLHLFLDVANNYSFVAVPSDFIITYTVTIAGSVAGPFSVVRSLGLGSKSFIYNNVIYMLGAYQGPFEPSYFLFDSSGHVIAKLAFSNGGGYLTTQVLPNASVNGSTVQISYLLADLLVPTNKVQGSGQQNLYNQTGVNLAFFNLAGHNLSTAEIGNNLHMAGGFVWMYDGNVSVEHNFHLWPEQLKATPHTTGGNLTDDTYFYQVTYEWTDAQGNIHRSAPSVPLEAVVSGGGGDGSVTLNISTLRLTYKQNVRIVIYRWAATQQVYHQITDPMSPTLNDPTVDSITYLDTQSSGAIAENFIIYTEGGILENIAFPASNSLGLFKSRLMVVDAENPNLLWFSKQVIQSVPVEPSDLLTIFVAPTISSQGSTGPTLAVSAMDDKFIAFKKDAIYYITGNGPDNLGNNNDFSDPIFVTSTVGCSNQNSIVFSPNGLMFQSDKGVWILGRGLDTQYIGAPVQLYNNNVVTSALGIPGTNQVRFTMDDKKAVMYDYFFARWSTFTNVEAISSTLYQGMHTFLINTGEIRQETPGFYLDGTQAVLMAFTTAWMNLMGLQGFERAYMLYILGNYISPHTLNVTINFDYNQNPSQSVTINPTNFSGTWGTLPPYWGTGNFWGGNNTLEWWRIFLRQQKMTAFQVGVQEIFDSSFGTPPGAGLTFSGLNLVLGSKKGYTPLPAANSVG